MSDQAKLNPTVSLLDTVSNSDLTDLAKEFGEVGVDSLLNDGFLKEIPIIGSITSITSAGFAFRDYLFAKKVLAFLSKLSVLPPRERVLAIKNFKLNGREEDAAEALLHALEKSETSSVAELVGQAFRELLTNQITLDDFWGVLHILTNVPFHDLLSLVESESDDSIVHPGRRESIFASVGLGHISSGFGALVFAWDVTFKRHTQRIIGAVTK